MKLPIVKYVKAGGLRPFAGKHFLWWIFIDERFRGDSGLLAHELVHYRQFRNQPFSYHFLYWWSSSFRYQAEVEAYRKQLEYASDRLDAAMLFASYICTKYQIKKLTLEKVRKDLLA